MFFTNMAARGWVRAAAVAPEIVITGWRKVAGAIG
jgi:hypothetical protein